jgi:hypothetical protein
MVSDSSVARAFHELLRLEEDRIQSEAQEAARRQAEHAAAETRAREAALHAKRVAEAEAHMRVDAELQARDRHAEIRIAALRAELAAAHARRQALASSDDVMSKGPPLHARRRRAVAIVASGIALSLVLVGLALLREARAALDHGETVSRLHEVAASHRRSHAPADQPIAQGGSPTLSGPNEVTSHSQDAISEKQTRVWHHPKKRVTRPKPKPRGPTSVLGDLDRCGSDPTCGLEDEGSTR